MGRLARMKTTQRHTRNLAYFGLISIFKDQNDRSNQTQIIQQQWVTRWVEVKKNS